MELLSQRQDLGNRLTSIFTSSQLFWLLLLKSPLLDLANFPRIPRPARSLTCLLSTALEEDFASINLVSRKLKIKRFNLDAKNQINAERVGFGAHFAVSPADPYRNIFGGVDFSSGSELVRRHQSAGKGCQAGKCQAKNSDSEFTNRLVHYK